MEYHQPYGLILVYPISLNSRKIRQQRFEKIVNIWKDINENIKLLAIGDMNIDSECWKVQLIRRSDHDWAPN